MLNPTFTSLPLSPDQTVSWIHIGDTHLTCAGEQNEIDLGNIVDEINEIYANGGIDFVFVPGDIADDGSVTAYECFRKHLDRLRLPWCAIVGDHDVHEKSFTNFQHYVSPELYSGFSIGPYRFLRLNAFSVPRPDSFVLDDEQLHWLEKELHQCESSGQRAILLLHCYPSDLKQGGRKLAELIQRYPVLLLDMGHTHYNELSNDGKVLYSATRSTGQVEEGVVGYSITTLDRNVVSWHFVELGSPALVAITQPGDERLRTESTATMSVASPLPIRAKIWSPGDIRETYAQIGSRRIPLVEAGGVLWCGSLDVADLPDGNHDLEVKVKDRDGNENGSSVRLTLGATPERAFAPRDQDNAIGEWSERGLLGTQLGPNKNGRKW